MQLDFNSHNGAFVLRVPAGEAAVAALMSEHGFDFSTTASTQGEAVLFSREPYAAVAFSEFATDAAFQQLKGLVDAIAASWAAESSSQWRTPVGTELWPFQRASVAYALGRKHTLIGDQPGLGKTPIAITVANEIEARHSLVICPAGIRRQWYERIQEWSIVPSTGSMVPYGIIHTVRKGKDGTNPAANWHIVSYDLARTPAIGRALAAGRYDLLIIDEAHYLKTPESLRTRAIFGGGATRHFEPIAERADRILGLTGTPLPNRPREAYTLARALCFDAIDWMSEDNFRFRFNPSHLVEGERLDGSTYKRVEEKSGRHAELQARLRANFMVRHLKRDVMTQLHMPVYDLIHLEETAAVKAALHAESLLHINPEILGGADIEILGQVATVRRMMGEALAPQIADYVNMLIDGGEEKLVIFYWHKSVGDVLEAAWKSHGCVRLDGDTSGTQREVRKKQFIGDPRVQVFLGQMQVAGVGLDGLQQVAWHALIAEPDWTPGNNIQAFDRLDRGGQRNQVQADIFVAPNSFAERVLATALRKLQTTDKALDRRAWF